MAEAPESRPRPLTGGAVMSAASRIVVAVTGALTTILVARLLGPDGSGGYAVALSLVLLLVVMTTLGIEHGVAYYVSNGSWSAWPAFLVCLRLAAVTGTAGALAGVLARVLAPGAFAGLSLPVTAVACAALPFWLAFYYAAYVGLAIDRYEAYVLPPALQSTLAMVLAGTGALAFDLPGAVVGTTVATAAVGVGAVVWALRRLPRTRTANAPGQVRRAISFGVKGYAANALQILNYRLDLFILSSVASAAAVGHYAVAVAVTTVLWLLPNALAEVIFPRVARLSAREGDEAHREMVELKGLRHVVMAVVAAAAVIAAALPTLVVPIYGGAFRPAVELGLILLPGTAAIGVANVLAASIVGRGRPALNLYIVLATVPPTIALYVLLIPELDATGAALASTISYTGNFALTVLVYRRVTGRTVLRAMLPRRDELDDLRRLPRAVAGWLRH